MLNTLDARRVSGSWANASESEMIEAFLPAQGCSDGLLRIREAVAEATARLRAGDPTLDAPDARLEVEVLLGHTLDLDRASLYARLESPLPAADQRRFNALMTRRLDGEPVPYITGVGEFYGLAFHVDRRVLIPRPETELLVEAALQHLSAGHPTRPDGSSRPADSGGRLASAPDADGVAPTIADVGCGSGCIAVSLAVHLPAARVYATDISRDALEVARLNAERHGVADRVILVQGDLLAAVPVAVDVIVANLPYIRRAELATLPRRITAYEPTLSLDGGPDGLAVIRRLLRQLARAAASGPACGRIGRPAVFLEVGHDQGAAVLKLLASLFPGARAGVRKDLAGHDRLAALWWD